ncbi:dethiobiotin synthase [Candidatus Sumerlaeota bacterium]|nr:dethiobiotin synthase [Candidatus Sumerlaeota bacterium]
MSGLIIAGTGTDVGKTFVAAAILRYLRDAGCDAVPMKPVQTGCRMLASGAWEVPDLDFVLRASAMQPPADERRWMAPFVYREACSPHLAARMSNEAPPDAGRIISCAGMLLAKHDALLVELAGGLMVPLNDAQTNLDLMIALKFPVVLVALPGLGTINHTLLSIEAIRRAGLELLGVIICAPEPVAANAATEDNPAAIAQFGRTEILGNIPHQSKLDWPKTAKSIPGLETIRRRLIQDNGANA